MAHLTQTGARIALRALKATEFEYGLQEGLTSLGFVAGSRLLAGFFDRLREGQGLARALAENSAEVTAFERAVSF